jgi:HSP20 family protein
MDERLDAMAEWFSPDIAVPFGRVQRHPAVRSRPRIDVAERDNTLIITAELPGVGKDHLHVDLEHGALVILGETRANRHVNDENYVRVERNLASYYRRVPLPFDAHVEEIKATLTDGVLEVRIPEPPQTQSESKTITVD